MPKVLLVDDSPLQLMILQDLPALQGAQVSTAETGQAAIAACAEADVIVLDGHLPDLSFAETLQGIQAANPTGLVALFSARPEAFQGTVEHVLAKDGDLATLDAQIADMLGSITAA